MLKRFFAMAAAAAATLTSACEDGPATVGGGWRSPATWSALVHATSQGPLLAEIHGDPFHLGGERFRAAVAEAMSGQIPSRPFQVTPDADRAPRPLLRVVVAFQPAPTLDARDLCRGRLASVADSAGDKITVLAAFCEGETLLASVSGWVAKVDGPQDRRFRRLMGQMVRDLLGGPT